MDNEKNKEENDKNHDDHDVSEYFCLECGYLLDGDGECPYCLGK